MNNIIKKLLSKRALLIAVVVVLLGFVFCWFEIRPSMIRKECSNYAKKEAIRQYYREPSKNVNNEFSKDAYNFIYKLCLESKGL